MSSEKEPTPTSGGPLGHAHFWKGEMSRRTLLGASAGATGAILGARALWPVVAHAEDTDTGTPRPIPGTIAPGAPFHLHLPGRGAELSSITDFDGVMGIANVGGTGTGTNTSTGATSKLLFDVDVRFMQGRFVGTDGKRHKGTFGFI